MAKNRITGYRAVLTSTLVSVGDVLLNFTVAAITGSTVIFAQGLQGLADVTTTSLLLVGLRRSKREPTKAHPFGYGRELFFWVLIAGLFAFIISGGIAIYRAIGQMIEQSPLESVHIGLIVMSIGVITNGYSLMTSLRRMSYGASNKKLMDYIKHSSLVETKMTLLVDFMGTISAVFGLMALGLFALTDNPIYDGIGALIIGTLTALGALFVITDLHGLIVGRSPARHVIDNIRKSALKVDGVLDILDLRASTIGSNRVLAILEVHFKDDLTTNEIEKITDKLKEQVINKVPQVTQVQIEAETPDSELI